MDPEVLIKAEQVSRYYGRYRALNNISFSVMRGQVVAFLGRNGAGKSTLMQIISGVLPASSGRICIAGHDLLEQHRQAKLYIGFLPEDPPLYQDVTVDEYLLYSARLHGVASAKLADSLANCKYRCGLENVGRRLTGNLSRGFQQRVGIAQAIIHSPSIVILDEPTSALDPIQQADIRKLIRELADDHSVILSTHLLHEVHDACDRVLIINKGTIVLDQPTHTLVNQQDRQIINVAFRFPPVIEELENIPGINKVEMLDNNRFRLHGLADGSFISSVSTHAISADWGLYEMSPETGSLEEIFMRMTDENYMPL